jgi:hypothetical protein
MAVLETKSTILTAFATDLRAGRASSISRTPVQAKEPKISNSGLGLRTSSVADAYRYPLYLYSDCHAARTNFKFVYVI